MDSLDLRRLANNACRLLNAQSGIPHLLEQVYGVSEY